MIDLETGKSFVKTTVADTLIGSLMRHSRGGLNNEWVFQSDSQLHTIITLLISLSLLQSQIQARTHSRGTHEEIDEELGERIGTEAH